MKIATIAEANKILEQYVPLAKELIGKDITLERMWPLLAQVGDPQEKLRVIHIAGTSGKTSTSYFIASILAETGATVGLTVSPHIDSVTERVQIAGAPLPDAEFCDLLGEFLDKMGDLKPTYFELLIAFAYWVFARKKVDYAVMETGLGGLHDSTNVANRPDKICVITDIGFDHMHVLGNTITCIATQKAGIIQPQNQVYMYRQSTEVMSVMDARCTEQKATLHAHSSNELSAKYNLADSSLPEFQQRNWLLARATVAAVIERDDLRDLDHEKELNSQSIQVPGRMDTITIGNKTLIMDGAHNQQKMHAFVTSFQARYAGKKATILLSLKVGKEYPGVIDELLPITDNLILTTFKLTQDMQSTAIDPEPIANYCYQKGFDKVKIISDQVAAYNALMESNSKIRVITGSFYLLSQIRTSQATAKKLPKQG